MRCRALRRSLGPLALAAGLLWAPSAQAEVTSWLSLGFGGARIEQPRRDAVYRLQMPIDIGVGLPPSMPVTVGVGVKMLPSFKEGVDYGAYLRAATQGYALGGFGVALDAGAYTRTFGSNGFLGVLNVGIPWGGVLSVIYTRGSEGEQTIGGTIGIDFLRLTVYRLAGQEQWPNVYPAWKP